MAPTPVLAPAFLDLASSFASLPNVTFGPFAARQYTPEVGSCGWTNSSSQYVASIKVNSTRSNDAFCGREIEVETDVGSVTATIVDTCLSCGYDYLALSEKAFQQVSDDVESRITASYIWTQKTNGSSQKKQTKSESNGEDKPSAKAASSPSSSSSKNAYTPTSSAKKEEYTSASSSSSEKAEYTPSSSSKKAEYTPSSSASKEPEYTPSSSSYKEPEYTPSSTSQKAQETPKQQTQQSSGGYSGQATYFYQGGQPGACGNYNQDSAYIVALDYRMYGGGSHCGQQVRVTNNNNGASITASVADLCPTCASSGSLDLSVGAFQALGSLDAGVLPISWSWA